MLAHIAPVAATATIRPMQTSSDRPVQLSVSIVVHNSSRSLLAATLASLVASLDCAHERGLLFQASVCLVDNASSDAYRKQLDALLATLDIGEYVTLDFLPQSENVGFGRGHNQVLSGLTSDYHLILNPDAELAEDALANGLAALRADDRIALLSPRFTADSGDQEYLCKAYPSVLVLLLRGFAPAFVRNLFRRRLYAYELRDTCNSNRPAEVEIASGCVMLLRTGALRAVGGFNEDFFLYFEDFDLSLRIASQGSLVFEPAMGVVHHGGYAARKGWSHVKLFMRSGIQFFRLHGWRWI